MTTARTARIDCVLQLPGAAKPLANTGVTVELNVAAFTNDHRVQKLGRRVFTSDATGQLKDAAGALPEFEINDDLDPAGTWYTMRIPGVKNLWSFQLTAAHADQTVLFRDVLVANPVNPDPVVAGVPMPPAGTPAGDVPTVQSDGSIAYEPGGTGGGAVDSVNGHIGAVVLAASDVGAQPSDVDLTTIAALDSTQAGVVASDGAGWLRKTYAQLKAALALAKADVGLGSVDNTSDASKPISTATATALAAKADLVGGLVPTAQIPSLALTTSVVVANQAAMLALTTTQVQPGDLAIRTDGAGTFILTATDPTQLANWTRLNAPTDVVVSVNGQTGTVVLAKGDVGLSNVDNTSDANKPVSTAQAAALVPKSLGTAKGDLIGFSASGTPVRIPGGGDGSVPTYDSTAPSGISAQAALNASSLLLGATNGALKKPWGEQAFVGPELWSATYFDTATVNSIAGNTSTTPSLTGNGTAQHKMTRFRTGYVSADGQVQEVYRFDFTLNSTCPSGWAYIAIRGIASGGSTVSGTEIYLWGANDGTCTNYRSALDYKLPANSGVRWIEVEVGTANNVPSGTIGLSNVSFRQVAEARPPLNVSWSNSTGPNGLSGQFWVDVPVTDPVTGVVTYLRKIFGNDGQLQVAPVELDYFPAQYTKNYVKPSTTSLNDLCASPSMSATGQRKLHISNAGQIMGVVKADLSTELRCNTHGGEWGRRVRTVTDGVVNGTTTLTSATANFTSNDVGAAVSLTTGMGTGIRYIQSVTNSTTAVMNTVATASGSSVTVGIGNFATNFLFEADYGDGSFVAIADGVHTHGCRRVRVTAHTEVVRSDQTTPFANVDQVFTVFDDGTMRFDRTITFVADQAIYQWFYFMHSFDTAVLEQGRMGFGQQVLPQTFDPRQYLTAPVAATVTQLTTGTYGSVTRTYYTTAITPQGESTLSPSVASTTAAGTTNSFQVNQPATQTGQTGWAIYDSTGRLAVLPVSVTTWVDTGPQFGTAKAPTVNTATILPGTQVYTRTMSDRADWAAFYDSDSTGVVFGTVTDRDNALTYPGATSLTCELDSHPGVLKNYWQLQDGTGYRPLVTAADLGSYRQTLTNGTVLTTTAYSFTYAPLDRANWHREIANRGQGFKQFNTVYPST